MSNALKVNVKTLTDALKKFEMYSSDQIDELQSYLHNDITSATAQEGAVNLEKVEKLIRTQCKGVPDDQVQLYISIVQIVLSKHYTSQCDRQVIINQADIINYISSLNDNLYNQLKAEKQAHNETRKRYNEAQQSEEIQLPQIQTINMTITAKKNLSAKDIENAINRTKMLIDKRDVDDKKMKRLCVSEEDKGKIDRIYAGRGDAPVDVVKVNNKKK